MVAVAVVIDSRNVFHQSGDALGRRALPTVDGVRHALARYGLQAAAVHVGLALPRPSDRDALARQHARNEAYRQAVLAAGGDVLLGELHRKKSGAVEEKMVDGACNVRIARYVEEYASKRTNVQGVVVLSRDIDLLPAISHAVDSDVPIVVAALDVVQHRPHPWLLLGPHSFAEAVQADEASETSRSGHELRELLTCALVLGDELNWSVTKTERGVFLQHNSGLRGVLAPGVALPQPGQHVALRAVDVTWDDTVMGRFPLLVCDTALPATPTWEITTVLRRTAPMQLELRQHDGTVCRVPFPQGGVTPQETMLVHRDSGRALGRVVSSASRPFDPDIPRVVRVVSALPKGGYLAHDARRVAGLLVTRQPLAVGRRVPVVQVDAKSRGPAWMATGTPLPETSHSC